MRFGLLRCCGASLAMLFVGVCGGTPASAECGLGKQAAYDDITAIRFFRSDCYAGCPSYEVLFSALGLYYVGRANVPRHGTYHANVPAKYVPGSKPKPLLQAIAILRHARFYELSLTPSLATDVPLVVVAAERCDITTKLQLRDYGQRPDIDALANRLDVLIGGVHWVKESNKIDSPLYGNGFASIPQ